MNTSEIRKAAQPPDGDDLLRQACPHAEDVPFFNHCMRLAREQGMNWGEGLLYTIEQRNGLDDGRRMTA